MEINLPKIHELMSRTENLGNKHRLQTIGFENSIFVVRLTYEEYDLLLKTINNLGDPLPSEYERYLRKWILKVEEFYADDYCKYKPSIDLINRVLDEKNRLCERAEFTRAGL